MQRESVNDAHGVLIVPLHMRRRNMVRLGKLAELVVHLLGRHIQLA